MSIAKPIASSIVSPVGSLITNPISDVVASVVWYLTGGTTPELVYDSTSSGGLTLDGSSDVSAFVNLGSESSSDLSATGGTNSPTATVDGNTTVTFDGGSTYEPYEGAATYAGGVFASTKEFMMFAAYAQSVLTGDQAPFAIGKDGSGSPRVCPELATNGITHRIRYHDGSTNNTMETAPFQRVVSQSSYTMVYHNGVDEITTWANGRLIGLRESETTLASQVALSTGDAVSIGGLANGVFDLKAGFLGAAFDNSGNIDFAETHQKAAAAHTHYGVDTQNVTVVWCLGQSNAAGDFTNSDPVTFAAEAAYKRTATGNYDNVLDPDGFGHNDGNIGSSNPAIYFADEWKTITGDKPIFQQLAFSGQPITPGLTSKTAYWAPKNAVGDAAGDTSLMETWKNDFQRLADLVEFSPELNVNHNIAFIVEGEADAVGFTAGDDVTQPALESYMNDWLNDLRDLYNITTFAIVNIGRSGQNATEVANNAAGVTLVRAAWSAVIASRSDAYDVFPHLNSSPDPFTLDDLVVDGSGRWVSGQANNADGIHYTDEMYQAFGRTAARNLATSLGLL